MGYRGKVELQEKARALRLDGRTLADIAETLGVSKSSVSLWVRDIPIEVRRRKPVSRRPHAQRLAKLAQIEALNRAGGERIGELSDEVFLAAGAALYAGEGAKRDGEVAFTNVDPSMIRFFCAWFRQFFEIDEVRLRARVYLHEGLDLDCAEFFWAAVIGIPRSQFTRPYRAAADPTIRGSRHSYGCVTVKYHCARTHREVMGLVRALLALAAIPG